MENENDKRRGHPVAAGVILSAVLLLMAGLAAVSFYQARQIRSLTKQLEQVQTQTSVAGQLTAAAEAVSGACVGISGYREQTSVQYDTGFSPAPKEEVTEFLYAGHGSGVILGDGLVLTCYHVIRDLDDIRITGISGNESLEAAFVSGDEPEGLKAEVLREDPVNDLALLEVSELKGLAITPPVVGSSSEITYGEPILCISDPASEKLGATLTFGVVSGTDRTMGSLINEGQTVNVFQIDAAINGGSSGGGVFSLDGKLLGIVTRKYVGSTSSDLQLEGISMCIPGDEIRSFMEQP